MLCPLCTREIVEFMSINMKDGQMEVKVHIDCFFKDIPEKPSLTDPNRAEKAVQREKLIQKRGKEIVP